MRIPVFFVLCLVLNNSIAQTPSPSPTLPSPVFNCEELSSNIQNLKESSRSKKEKFTCILNLLKSALCDELENSECQNQVAMNFKNALEDRINYDKNQMLQENIIERENTKNAEKSFDMLIAKENNKKQENTKDFTNNSNNIEVPTMIPIFKQKPVIRNNFADKINPTRPRSIPIAPEAIHVKSIPISNSPKFTIPCQRAADVLDMSNIPLPRKVSENIMQPNVKPVSTVPKTLLANQTPATSSVHCEDSNDSVAILFKPKAISMMKVYGNLLKKITITVLVPYHMSKMGQ